MIINLKRFIPLLLLIILFFLFYYFKLYTYFTFESLKAHREFILIYKKAHFFLLLFVFMSAYTLMVAASIPGATLLTLASGFLFGPLLGTSLVVISATIGAFILFVTVQFAFRDWIKKKFSSRINLMKQGFQKNAFSYLLFLRLVPLFPFWLVNIVAAILDISKHIFLIATFVGIIPGSIIYVLVGNSLGYLMDANQKPNLYILFDPRILFPLLALALLSLLPIGYQYYRKRIRAKR